MPIHASPLRYPGGKSVLLGLTARLLKINGLMCGHYAEPYAGGCGLALGLLYGGFVSEIHINDIDPAVWSLWYCILNHTEDFVRLIETKPVSIREWERQKKIYTQCSRQDVLGLAFSAFYLNRTNVSGVIGTGGPIGGFDQLGPYKIGCRFNREELSNRVRRVARYSSRIHLSNCDGIRFLHKEAKALPSRSFFFIDPPYFSKGSRLYTNFYSAEDHSALANNVTQIKQSWVLTYDNVPDVHALYKKRRKFLIGISYSLRNKRVGSELLMVSKGLRVPSELDTA